MGHRLTAGTQAELSSRKPTHFQEARRRAGAGMDTWEREESGEGESQDLQFSHPNLK